MSGRLAERCRDGLNEGDVIEAVGLGAPALAAAGGDGPGGGADAFAAIRLRRRAPQIADAASGGAAVR